MPFLPWTGGGSGGGSGTQPYQFRPETYGALGNGKIINDAVMTSGSAVLTTPGLAAPAAPTVANATSGGTIAIGTYQVKVSFVNAYGETLPSGASSTTTTTNASTITITAPTVPGNATGWYAYVTQAGGVTFTRQQVAGQPTVIGTNLVLTAPPTSTGAAPPGASTAASNPFTAADAGKNILVSTAAGAFAHLATTISTVTGSGNITLAANATANTGGTPGAITYYGTDDTAAIRAAIAAAVAYAQANHGYAEVLFSPVTYIVAGPAVIGGTTGGNAQIPLPIIPGQAAKVTLVFRGTEEQTPLAHWLQVAPQAAGTVLACARTDGTNDGTWGAASMIGGPGLGAAFGSFSGVFSNMLPVIDGVTLLVPYNSTYGGFDFLGVGEANVISGSCMAAAVAPASNAPAPTMSNQANISNQWTRGLRMPDNNNNANSNVNWWSCEGLTYGFSPSEHCAWVSTRSIYCTVGMEVYATGGTGTFHTMRGVYSCIEACGADIFVNNFGGVIKMDLGTWDTETSGGINDANNALVGTIGWHDNVNTANYHSPVIAGCQFARIISLDQLLGAVASPQAPPASGSGWPNNYYRDAWITLHATTITAVSIDGTAQNGLQASPATYTFFLGPGKTYTPTYTGTLTHTVTLM